MVMIIIPSTTYIPVVTYVVIPNYTIRWHIILAKPCINISTSTVFKIRSYTFLIHVAM